MTDINPDVPDKPIVVPASPVGLQAAAGMRDIIIVLTALPALIAVLGTRNVTQIVAFLTSAQFAPALGVIVLAGTVLWRQWLTRRQHADDVKMGTSAKNSVAIVQGST